MLDIIVNGQRIAIERGTSIQVEFNSSIFSTDGIEGDVAYSFDVPAAPNDLIFESARFVYVQRRRKYACTILLAGTPIGNGNLYVTKATKDTYSCELAVNAFPDGWRDRKLRDNDYGDDIIISDNYANHKQNWLDFLQSTLAADSIVKFPLFLDEDYYDDNEDFGFFEGFATYPIGPVKNYDKTAKFVNRLSFYIDANNDPHVTDAPIDDLNGQERVEWRIFNKMNYISKANSTGTISERKERNQFSFTPAIRLSFIFRKVMEASGYKICGNFITNADFLQLWHQSLQSMDGTYADYASEYAFSELTRYEDTRSYSSPSQTEIPFVLEPSERDCVELAVITNHQPTISYDRRCFKHLYPGTYRYQITVRFNGGFFAQIVPTNYQYENSYSYTVMRLRVHCEDSDNPVGFGCTPSSYTIRPLYSDEYPVGSYTPRSRKGVLYDEVGYKKNDPIGTRAGGAFQAHKIGDTDIYEVSVDFYADIDLDNVGKIYIIETEYITLPNVEHFIEQNNDWILAIGSPFGHLASELDCKITYSPETQSCENIYTNHLHYGDHMPDKTNSEFLSALCNLFGVALFCDSIEHKMELSLICDILKSKTINLTNFILTNETSIGSQEKKLYTYTIPPLISGGSIGKILPEITYRWEFNEAGLEYGNSVLVRSENKYMTSVKEGDSYLNWKFEWRDNGGNNEELAVGENDDNEGETKVEVAVKIPHLDRMMHWDYGISRDDMIVDYGSHTSHDTSDLFSRPIDFPIISGRCGSFLNDSDAEMDLILLRYRGWGVIPYNFYVLWKIGQDNHIYIKNFSEGDRYYERMSPVCYDNSNGIGNRVPGNDLTATGEHSIGEVYVKPWLQLLSNYEKITYRFLLPPAKLLEVIRLFRPQNAAPENQVRWIFVENVRVLPIRMTFEIVEGKDQILTEIECAKPVV